MKGHGARASPEWLARFAAKGGTFSVAGKMPGNLPPISGEPIKPRAPGIEKPHVASKMNKTENLFYRILQIEKHKVIGIQAITLRLASRVRYTPDFSTVNELGRVILWEVKGGFMRDDGWQKLKIAASQYPYFDFMLAQYRKGEWTRTRINV